MSLEQGCEYCGAVLPLVQLEKMDVEGAFVMVCSSCADDLRARQSRPSDLGKLPR